jgi:hypothetical protein
MAEKEKKLTIYQSINKFFNLDDSGFQDSTPQSLISSVGTPIPQEKKIIIKGNTPEEIHRKGLELEQKRELQNKFFRTTDRGFQKALQYEAARLPAYIDYEGMEYYPIISSALDLFMEEATTIGSNGKMLNIYSNKDRIKTLLEEFFYDIVNVNVNLPFWVRNTVKYGDNFVLQYGERKKGITHIKQMVNYEIERFERIQNGKPLVKFKERMTGDEFNVFEIAHFRLLGDDKYLPYGSSVLNKVRRVFRQLVMAEDAMLTYRIVRAGEKKVFKIDVGNIDEDDIESYIFKVATKFKKTSQVNPNDGQIDYRFNILGNDEDYFIPVRNANTQTGIDTLAGACLALNTKIELLDGRSLELNKIIEEFESGKELWSYSINPESGKLVPGKITWAGITRKNSDIVKITLDNGENILCTPDHKFPTKFNGIKEAKDLLIGESMWAFNKKFEKIKNENNEYEMIYDHSINDWVYTHRMVDNYFNGDINKNTVRHHKDFNRFNNEPLNLIRMLFSEHFKLHSENAIIGGLAYKEKYETDVEFKDNVNERLSKGRYVYHNKLKNDIKFKNLISKKQSIARKKYLKNLNDVDFNNAIKHLHTPESRIKAINSFNENVNKSEILRLRGLKESLTKSLPENVKKQSERQKNNWKCSDFRNSVIEKQTIKYSEKLLDLLIDYYNEYDRLDLILENIINVKDSEWLNEFNLLNLNNNQLKKMTKITNNNIDKLLKHFGYDNWRDFKQKVPCYNHKIVSIEYLSEKQDTGTITIDGQEQFHNYHNFALTCGIFTNNSNLNDIMDIEYLRDNLFIGLGIPKPFLSFQDASGAGKNMAQYDIRFAKKVNRIQQAMIQELNKMAMIHLYLLGYSGDDLKDFMLTLTNPSTQQDLLKSELMREQAQTYTELTRAEAGIAAMSHTNAKRIIFNMSDREIVEDLKQQKMEKVIMQEFQDAPVSIKKSGLFTDIDKRYGESVDGMPPASGTTEQGGMPPVGGDMGGAPPLGGDMGGAPPVGGELPPPIAGLPNQTPSDLPPVVGDSVIGRKTLTEDEFNSHVEKLVYGNTNEPEHRNSINQKIIIKENDSINTKLNEDAINMISEIDDLLKKSESINFNNNITEAQDVDIDDIENLEL